MTGTIILRSSYADLYVDRVTGDVLKRDYAAMGGSDEWDDVQRFDPTTFPADSETDVLLVGFWDDKGVYLEPQLDAIERDYNTA